MSEVLSFADMVEVEFLNLYNDLRVFEAPEKRKADIIDSLWADIYKKVFKPGPDDIKYNNQNSKLKTFDVINVQEVTEMFIKLNKRYGGVIKFNQFSNLTGIHPYTLNLWEKANTTNGYIFNINNNDMNVEYNNLYIIPSGDNKVIFKNNRCNKSSMYNKDNIDNIDKYNSELSTLRFDIKKKLRSEMQDSNTNGLSNDTMGQAIRANNEEELGKLYEPKRMITQAQIKNTITVEQLQALEDIKGTKDP